MNPLARVFQVDSAMNAELNREKASGLGRTGRRLEEAIAACQALAKRLSSETRPAARREVLDEYRAHRERALQLRWELEVQREAMGLRRHTDLEHFFPIPGPLEG